jgi:hypothetical protein
MYDNLKKFSFGMRRFQYLIDIVYEHDVHEYPSKIQVIRDYPDPITLTKL